MGKYCYAASARRRARRLGAQGEERGGGILCRHAHSLLSLIRTRAEKTTRHDVSFIAHYMMQETVTVVQEKKQRILFTTAELTNRHISRDVNGRLPESQSHRCRSLIISTQILTSCRWAAATICPRLSPPPRGRRSASCGRADGNVTAVSHGQHVPTPTAAAA